MFCKWKIQFAVVRKTHQCFLHKEPNAKKATFQHADLTAKVLFLTARFAYTKVTTFRNF